MLGVRRIFGLSNRKLSFTAGLLLSLVAMVASVGLAVGKASAAVDCDDNAIIKCGFTNQSDFIKQVRDNSTKNDHHDLQAFYANYDPNFHLSASDYDNFAKYAVLGTATRDGHIVVDGKTVASNGITFGRSASAHQPNATVRTVNGVNYYGNVPNITFASGVQSIPIYVLFDGQGTMRFAVMPACGNPEIGTVVKTSASCSVLNSTPVAGKANTYNFTAAATKTGNATIKSFVYNFGDGSPTVETTDGNTPVPHTYTKSGSFKASVTVYASVPGDSNWQLPSVAMCMKTIVIPSVNCIQLNGAILDKSQMSYTFTVTATISGGATLTGADFDFGDGNKQSDVKPASATTVTVPHTYVTSGRYNTTATLHFTTPNGTATAPTCAAWVTPETVTPECKPGVPIGSPQCIPPCQPGSSVPPESAECQTPELPNTGAGNTIAIFAAVVIGGFLVYRQLLYRKHKAAFVAAELGTSPLPLGDPLSDQPLADTPLAQQKSHSFRRKRPF